MNIDFKSCAGKVCVEFIHFSPDKKRVEVCISCGSSMWQAYIESDHSIAEVVHQYSLNQFLISDSIGCYSFVAVLIL